jgi:hypothetical protein
MVEPIFPRPAIRMLRSTPTVYSLTSSGSGKRVDVHFCPRCGTKLYLGFERFPDVFGVYAGSFDDPSWIERAPDRMACLFLDNAQTGAIIPASVPVFRQHRMSADGVPDEPILFDAPFEIGRKP